MKSSDILLSLEDERLEVYKLNGCNEIRVCYKGAEIKDGYFLQTVCGVGKNFETACDDYWNKIRGKKLVFRATSNSRREVSILG